MRGRDVSEWQGTIDWEIVKPNIICVIISCPQNKFNCFTKKCCVKNRKNAEIARKTANFVRR